MLDVGQMPTEMNGNSPERSRVTVAIAADLMTASVTVSPPVEGEGPITTEEVLAALESAGVVFGIDTYAVEKVVALSNAENATGLPVQVAKGLPPEHGEDGTISYHESLSAEARRPKLLPDGTVDMFDLNTVRNVAKDTVLAAITKHTKGTPGTSVRGTTVAAIPGRPAPFTAGRGTAFDPEQLVVKAAINGHAGLALHEITVTDHYHISGDLGLATGNIDFVGSVRVVGSIQPGFTIKAQGDVEVLGSVEGAIVESQGNVTVQGGIVGGRRGTHIRAKGNVRARFIESAEVSAGGSVWAKDGIVQSRIKSGDSVEVLGRRGVIVGGSVFAKNRVCAQTLGSHLGAQTELAVGITEEVRQERTDLRTTVKKVTSQLEQADQLLQMTTERIQRGDKSPGTRARLAQAAALENELLKSLTQAQNREEELDKQLLEGREAYVQASEHCFQGVNLLISGIRYQPPAELPTTHFVLDDLQQVAVVPGVRPPKRAPSQQRHANRRHS